MHSLISWFVHRPLIVNLIMVMVFLAGFLTIADMRYEYNPAVDMGVVNITTVKSGAGPEEVELSITLPLEEELLEVEGISKLLSNSMENLSVITLNLDLEAAPKEEIMRDVQQAVDRAATRLPQDLLEKPLLEEQSTLVTPVMEVHVTGNVPEVLLRDTARKLADGLREVEGIASVEKVGYRRPEVKIQLQPEKLAWLGISHEEIINAIRSRNLRESGGAVDSFISEKKIVAVGQFQTPKDVADVVVRAAEPGNSVLLRDVAEIVEGFEDWEVQSRVDGRMSIALQARKKELADEVHTAANVRRFVQQAQLPPGVELVMVADISRLTINMLDMLTSNALLGLASVFLLLYYFLRARIALWVAIGIPFSVCLCFLLLSAIGVTINVMTLTAIILLMGILVDDAVVVSENTQRLRHQGFAPLEASIEGAAQVSHPVIFSALTTMLAFAPLMFISGANGDFMVPFPLTVIVLLCASLFECLCLLPTHLAHIPPKEPPRRRAFEALRSFYHGNIEVWLRHRGLTLGLFTVAFVVIMGAGASTIRFSLFPDIDIDTVHVKVEMPRGTRFEDTVAAVEQLEQGIRERTSAADLLNITSQVGHHDTDFYGATEGRNHAWALISVQLKPLGQRNDDTDAQELVESLQRWGEQLRGFESLVVQALTDVPVMGEPVQIEVISSGDERYLVAEELLTHVNGLPGITSAWTSYRAGKDVIDLEIRYELLASRGLTVEQLIRALSVAVDGLLVDELQTLDERVRYRLQLPPSASGQLQTLQNLAVINKAGQPVYLSAVADFRLRPGEADIKHYLGKRTVTVFGQIDNSVTSVGRINAEIAQWIAGRDWPRRYPMLRLFQGGEMEETAQSFGDLGRAAMLCLLAIFAALVILFNSVSQPLLILLCLPFGLMGVVLCYMVQGMAMGMMAFTGIIGLVGVLVNDSLVLLHSLNRERHELGRPMSESEVAGVARRRFRPILITSITTAVGLFPTAYGIMGENSYITPMVMSMAWGVVFGGIVSLVLLPVLYMLEQDLRALLRRPFRGETHRSNK